MTPRLPLALLPVLLAAAAPARAGDEDFCVDRPGAGTPACTLGAGQAMVEITGVGFERDADAAGVTTTTTVGDVLLRYGLGASTEVQAGVTGFVSQLARDRAGGAGRRDSGIGDSFVAVRHALPGDTVQTAVQAFVTLPTGGARGAGTWGAGLLVPIELPEIGGFALAFTPEIDAAPDADGAGRHLAYGGVIGVSHALGASVTAGVEYVGFQDDDPAGARFASQVTGSLAWQVNPRLQLDAEVDAGVGGPAPDVTALIGLALRL